MRKNTEIINEMVARGFQAEEREVIKNGVVIHAITFGHDGDSVRPSVDPANFTGMSVPEICDRFEQFYENRVQFDGNKLTDPEFIKDNCRLCLQKKSNENIAKFDYLDLEVIVRVFIDGESSYKVPAVMLNSIPDLFEIAKGNTIFTLKTSDMMGMPIFTNSEKMYGAIEMFTMRNLKKFCQENDCKKIWIMPSSIHEVLAAPYSSEDDREYMNKMIQEINRTELEPKEVLSDHVYLYNAENNEITY